MGLQFLLHRTLLTHALDPVTPTPGAWAWCPLRMPLFLVAPGADPARVSVRTLGPGHRTEARVSGEGWLLLWAGTGRGSLPGTGLKAPCPVWTAAGETEGCGSGMVPDVALRGLSTVALWPAADSPCPQPPGPWSTHDQVFVPSSLTPSDFWAVLEEGFFRRHSPAHWPKGKSLTPASRHKTTRCPHCLDPTPREGIWW